MTTDLYARVSSRAWRIVLAAVATIAFAWTPCAHAQDDPVDPADLMKICSLYGAGFHYLPGTDICINSDQRDARMQTAGGTWRWWMPDQRPEPVASPKSLCGGGLVKFADIDNSGLAINEKEQFETTARMPVSLEDDEYVSQVLFLGGFTGVGRGSFCMFWSYDDPKHGRGYLPLVCMDTAANAAGTVALGVSPRFTRPPAVLGQMFLVGANGYPWPVATTAEVGGKLEVWLCIKKGIRP